MNKATKKPKKPNNQVARLVKVPYGILRDMNQILNYQWDEESRHYEEMKTCDNRRHVFTYMRRVRAWLELNEIMRK
jgi:hypothetical protein